MAILQDMANHSRVILTSSGTNLMDRKLKGKKKS